MRKATTTAKKAGLYTTKHTPEGVAYRVRTNKRGQLIVPVTVEMPESDFLHHHRSAKAEKRTFPERIIAILAQN